MKNFSELFKKYKLRAEFETFASFGNALAEKGYIYEDSLFSHWQKGTRIPSNRDLILTVIKIFIEKEAINAYEEANELLASVNLGYLTREEEKKLFNKEMIEKKLLTEGHVDLDTFFVPKSNILTLLRMLIEEAYTADFSGKLDVLQIATIIDTYIHNITNTSLILPHKNLVYEIMASNLFIKAKRLIHAKHGSIYLVENDNLKRVYASAPILENVFPRKKGKTMKVYKEQQPSIDSAEYITSIHPELTQLGIGSDLVVPLVFRNKTIGVLSFLSHEGIAFTQRELVILQSMQTVQ